MIRFNFNNNIELLSPAGSFECVKAAISAGADAIYMGGDRYSARAYAKSAEENKIIDSIRYVKQNGKRFYLTVNTLFKQKELEEIFLYLDPLVTEGVDAFIVQDLGVAMMLKDRYKDVKLHASTQMTITSSKAIKLVRDLGFDKVVLARELSLREIKEIRKEVKDTIELEAFVHGSMCYSYSGACLMSSFIGGESGNRGRCKGPCRLPYKTIVANKSVGAKHRELAPYILSMKDMCALRNLKALIDAGVTSFKIEGRMRKPDYVEGVTRIYKKYIDNIIAEKNGNIVVKHGESDIEKDEQYLFKLYNKGGFTNYYEKHNGIDMIQRYERK
ncbi:MAG: U32 family peptidase [Lachnospiraceae bacterium]|nr:U32 family peptidase [Lachnospiraceae bacterium]